jgi:CBS domain-containing protein
MLKARDVMTRDVVIIGPDAMLEDAIRILVEHKISGMPVCDTTGKVIGMISEKDILNFIFSGNVRNTRVKEAMTRTVISFSSDTSLDKICLVMGEKQIRRVPIIDHDKLIGIVSRRSIIRIVLSAPPSVSGL